MTATNGPTPRPGQLTLTSIDLSTADLDAMAARAWRTGDIELQDAIVAEYDRRAAAVQLGVKCADGTLPAGIAETAGG